ncbi:MAG: hypothetical protein P8079_02720 [Gammaproteobacteria bacterium]
MAVACDANVKIRRGNFSAACLLCACLLAPLTAVGTDMHDVDMAVRVRDYARAAQLLKPLAQQGDAEAQYRLAGFYRMGTGVAKSHKTAVRWLRRAAKQGYVKAQYKRNRPRRLRCSGPRGKARKVRFPL